MIRGVLLEMVQSGSPAAEVGDIYRSIMKVLPYPWETVVVDNEKPPSPVHGDGDAVSSPIQALLPQSVVRLRPTQALPNLTSYPIPTRNSSAFALTCPAMPVGSSRELMLASSMIGA